VIKLRLSDAAALSILEQADFYRQAADSSLALRWEAAVDDAVQSLLNFPERGAPCRFRSESLAGLRWIPVPAFQKQMVFYRYLEDERTVLILKVVHGARDLETVLQEQA